MITRTYSTLCSLSSRLFLACMFIGLFMAALTAFSAVNENVLYSFQGPPNDGFNPLGRLVTDQFGNLYGTTWQGENCLETCGTVFQVTPPSKPGGAWTERLLYQFTGAADADGSGPNGGMIW